MPNTVYANFVLENQIENQLVTKLDMSQFLTVDSSLTEQAGMTKHIHVYTGTGAAEDLLQGVGNSADATISFADQPYTVGVTQIRGKYYDEEAMKDPTAIDALIKYLGTAIVNDFTAKVVAELGKASLSQTMSTWSYADFCDAIAKFPEDSAEGGFILVNKAELAKIRKNLGADLKYVEGFVRTGYVGHINGFAMYVSNAVAAGTGYIAFKDAVTAFVKKGVEVEQDRDIDKRENTVVARKVAVVALTNASRVVKLA